MKHCLAAGGTSVSPRRATQKGADPRPRNPLGLKFSGKPACLDLPSEYPKRKKTGDLASVIFRDCLTPSGGQTKHGVVSLKRIGAVIRFSDSVNGPANRQGAFWRVFTEHRRGSSYRPQILETGVRWDWIQGKRLEKGTGTGIGEFQKGRDCL